MACLVLGHGPFVQETIHMLGWASPDRWMLRYFIIINLDCKFAPLVNFVYFVKNFQVNLPTNRTLAQGKFIQDWKDKVNLQEYSDIIVTLLTGETLHLALTSGVLGETYPGMVYTHTYILPPPPFVRIDKNFDMHIYICRRLA